MGQGVGSAVISFPAAPGDNSASVNVTGLTGFTSTDSVEAWVMGEASATHNALEHSLAPIKMRITNPITGVGFTIQARSDWRLTGDFNVRYVFTS